MSARQKSSMLLPCDGLLGRTRGEPSRLSAGASWYEADSVGDGLSYRFPAGALAGGGYLTADVLLDGEHLAVFLMTLQEGDTGPAFVLRSSFLPQCEARIRLSLELVNLNRWKVGRQGAWLKAICQGQRVDLGRVDRIGFAVYRKAEGTVRWRMTGLRLNVEEPPALSQPQLPRGPLLDALGQSTLRDWPGKTRDEAEMTARLQAQCEASSSSSAWPSQFSRWGGWANRTFDATGFFRTHHDGRRWWLIDPDGHPFWSAGLDCVIPKVETAHDGLRPALSWLPPVQGTFADAHSTTRDGRPLFDYCVANWIRAFGPERWESAWRTTIFGQMRRLGFNTVGNWSDWQAAREARFPYVRPLEFTLARTSRVYREFPDVFSPIFHDDAARDARQLAETRDDAALIGYFLMNEPSWGFSSELPAVGMIRNTPNCATRYVLARLLRERYGDNRQLSRAWGMPAAIEDLEQGLWRQPLTDAALADLEAFSQAMVQRLFDVLAGACRAVDPNHLNLGARYHTTPPSWMLPAMRSFDVVSINCYRGEIPHETLATVAQVVGRPTMIGEYHFGALDVGLPASGIVRVADQRARGQAYQAYVETAAADANCVGAHYFTLYDQSALGRSDGEAYQIGLLDVCGRMYDQMAECAGVAHGRQYAIAAGLERAKTAFPARFDPVF